MHRSQVVGIGPSKAWFNCSFFKQAVRWYCLVVDDWLLPKGSLLVCFSHRDKAKLLVFYSHGWSKGMVALKVSWSAEQWASSSWVKDRLFSNCWSSISELVQSTRKERSKEKNYIARPKGLALGYSFNLKVSVIFYFGST